MTELDFNLLIGLDALLAEGGVTAAARRIGLSPSAMSRTLTRLRQVTGDPLLVRAGRHMVLTPYAEGVRERVRDTVLEARTLLKPHLSGLDVSRLDRTFAIRANEGFIEAFGPALIAASDAQAPGVRLYFAPRIDKDSRYLREGTMDLEVGVVANMGPEVHIQALFRDRFVGVVRAGHPLLATPAVTARDYVAFGHVVASRHGRAHGLVDDALAEIGLTRKVVSVVPAFPTALAVARSSDLIATLPASYLRAALAGGGQPPAIQSFELPLRTQTITVSQMWHPRLAADPAHCWLRSLVRQVCREQAGPASG
ncbi:MAG TPA: LysR family transcriptional regulator [Castellaniella sp.]|uniref:LysR family transcriptional regulator n=1 Tax=Castellaniella sp. TaxID=1955812 RepID=UPI002EF92291